MLKLFFVTTNKITKITTTQYDDHELDTQHHGLYINSSKNNELTLHRCLKYKLSFQFY